MLSGINIDELENGELKEIDKAKLKIFWNKHKTLFKCDSVSFGLSNGNLLKFSLSQNMPEVIKTIAAVFELDINFIDPVDGLNLYDFVDSEIAKLKKLQNSASAVAVYENYKAGIIGLGGKSNKKQMNLMKIKTLSLTFLLLATFSATANDFNSSILHNAKIEAIEASLNKAKSFIEIKADSIKKVRVILLILDDNCPPSGYSSAN